VPLDKLGMSFSVALANAFKNGKIPSISKSSIHVDRTHLGLPQADYFSWIQNFCNEII
jgi:hypothetical protein